MTITRFELHRWTLRGGRVGNEACVVAQATPVSPLPLLVARVAMAGVEMILKRAWIATPAAKSKRLDLISNGQVVFHQPSSPSSSSKRTPKEHHYRHYLATLCFCRPNCLACPFALGKPSRLRLGYSVACAFHIPASIL